MKHAVTGAFGFLGKHIASRLLENGENVITLTNSVPKTASYSTQMLVRPLDFSNIRQLENSLAGVDVLYNTYWVRFNHKNFSYAQAIQNSNKLFQAAKEVGVKRVIHISITNPSVDSTLSYFKGKAIVENMLIDSGLSYCILRPSVLFGAEGILINNIAWLLHHSFVFGIFGDGGYKLQPIFVDDLAVLAIKKGIHCDNCIINAVGPETFTYIELVRTVANSMGKRRLLVSIPPMVGYVTSALIGGLMRDIFITKDEIEGLMANLLYVPSPPVGTTKLTDWIANNIDSLGHCYANELCRRK